MAAAVFLVLAACGGDRSTAPTSTTATSERIDPTRRSAEIRTRDVLGDVDLVTAIEQPRYLEGTPRITIPVRFEGEGRFVVTGIAVRAPHFEPVPVEPIGVAMVPGQRVALQVDLGAPRCGDLEGFAPAVRLTVSVDDSPPAEVEAPVPAWLLEELHEARCAEAAVAEQATIRFGETRRREGASLATEVVLERAGGRAPVTLTELTGSVILVLEPARDASPIARLGRDDDVVAVPVTVTAARCDAHAVSGSTKTFVFHAWLQVAGSQAVRIDLRPGPELEAAMQDAIEACIAGSVTDPRTD